MLRRISLSSNRDYTFSSCVVAGDYFFTSHQGGKQDSDDTAVQLDGCFESLQETLAEVEATLDDVVQVNLLLKDINDFSQTKEVFRKFFKNGFPARSTITTEFVSPKILVQIDAIAYKPQAKDEVN